MDGAINLALTKKNISEWTTFFKTGKIIEK